MASAMDDSVGQVMAALTSRDMLNNSIIVFTSDNGGPTNHYDYNVASNWPLRGMKDTLWEGGLRASACVWSPLLKSRARVSHQLMHVTDWIPTLIDAITSTDTDRQVAKPDLSKLDGVSQWESLSENKPSARQEVLHNIDRHGKVYGIRIGDFKLVRPDWDNRDRFGWYPPEGVSSPLLFTSHNTNTDTQVHTSVPINDSIGADLSLDEISEILAEVSRLYPQSPNTTGVTDDNKLVVQCGVKPPDAATNCHPGAPCLYHMPSDPCEYHNLYDEHPEVVSLMYQRIKVHNATAVPIKNVPEDPRGYPVNNNWTWSPWVELDEIEVSLV